MEFIVRNYAYFRVDNILVDQFKFLNLINGFEYEVQGSRIIFEQVKLNVSLDYRLKFLNLIKFTLERGDLLIINGIDSLGSDFKEVYSSINFIFKKEIRLVCLEFSKKEISGDLKKIFLHFTKLCSDFEGKIGYKSNVEVKKKKKVGRPEIFNQTQKEEVLEKFKNGQSVYSLAKQYSVTRTVIQRILSKSINDSISGIF
jgi:putative DNA-invertase from lambdoid prophage Rac